MLKFILGLLLLSLSLVAFWNLGRGRNQQSQGSLRVGIRQVEANQLLAPEEELVKGLSPGKSGRAPANDQAQAGSFQLASFAQEPANEEVYRFQLHVQVRTKEDLQAPGLAGIEFDYGLASGRGSPLSQSNLVSVASDRIVLGQGTSDEQGSLDVEVSISADSFAKHRARGTVWIKPRMPGWMTSYYFGSLPGRARPLVQFEVSLSPGATIRGVVRSADGEPLAGCSIYGYSRGEAGLEQVVGEPCSTDASGAFEYNLNRSCLMRLRVEKENEGSAEQWLDVDLALAPQQLVFFLGGRGRLLGRLLDPDGVAVRDMGLQVRRIESSAGSLVQETPQGLTRANTRTDSQGHFEFRGLQPGDYQLLSRTEFTTEVLLKSIATGSELIDVEWRKHRMALYFVDSQGSPVDLDTSVGARLNEIFYSESPAPGQPDLTQSLRAKRGLRYFRRSVGAFIFDVNPGSTYTFGITYRSPRGGHLNRALPAGNPNSYSEWISGQTWLIERTIVLSGLPNAHWLRLREKLKSLRSSGK